MANSKKNGKKKHPALKWLKILITLIVLGAVAGIAMIAYVASDLPEWNPQQLSRANATLLYDDNGELFSRLHAEENRTEVSLDKVPDDLVNAFIAIEDKDFENHHGINFKGIMRAVVTNISSGDLTGQGASTITQQLAKNAFLSFDKKFERKIKEMILAFRLESTYSKDEIMEMYLNIIPFGAGSYGVQAAAETYFGKDVNELGLAECSLLAGLPQSPNAYNPLQHLERAKSRQKAVLNNMVQSGYIDQSSANQAYNQELEFSSKNTSSMQYGYFIDSVIEDAISVLSNLDTYEDTDTAIYRAGLKIHTTMNKDLQAHAEKYFADSSHFPNQSKNNQQIQAAMVILDHNSGEIKAVMGGRAYKQRRGFNRATSAYRQPGSSIKPLTVYAPALENGRMPFTVFDDSPITYKIGSSNWSPHNYDNRYRGLITMRTAVQWSINTYAVQLLDDIGTRTAFDFGKALGLPLVDTPGTNDLGLAPLSLGGLTKGVTPEQMAAAYGSLGNNGIYVQPHFITRIEDANGAVIYDYKLHYQRVMSEQTAWLMTNMMQTVVSSGTGTNAKVAGVETAGKTGTSEEYRDSWFCGITPQYATAVWMGYDEHQTMTKVYGGGYPAKLFKSINQAAHAKEGAKTFSRPPEIIKVSVCSKSGKLPSALCPEGDIISEFSVKQYAPTDTCDAHQLVTICNESGKIATRYCPDTQTVSRVRVTNSESWEPERIPPEECDIHTEFNVPDMFKKIINDHVPQDDETWDEDQQIRKKGGKVLNNIFNGKE